MLATTDGQSDRTEPGATTAVLDALIERARALGASTLHCEPMPGGGYSVRARISGALRELTTLRCSEADRLLDDARQYVAHPELQIGFSLSEPELADGAPLLIALSPDENRLGPLRRLGMPPALVGMLERFARRGQGLVVFTGAEGAGVSTSLDAAGQLAARGMSRVLRSPPPAGPPESEEALAAIRRQIDRDPDVLLLESLTMPGQVALAIRAAGEGRLVLAGTGAPNAVAAIARIASGRIDRFQLAANLRAVVSQRLVRRLCRHCRVPQQATGSESALLGFDSGSVVFAPGGCEHCDGTGYAGRTGVFSWIEIDSAMARLIDAGADEVLLTRHASLTGPSLGTAARAMVRDGTIPAAEAVRISRETTSTVTG
ncbi:ATPase, T2SS/T4P/T4SS family [Stakelama tenebrarum]|uniref:Type II secretion protein ATPase n=1 Tax=Stakelama tenebrarum TaxID=2711215 RepID=A0A6G6Y7Q2_9SPHN|nr:ATPase, T2SS/T4P/T4SS family [Sphingosinithalassobacter tenebrarum]QIG80955.1 type II secretion protein ATPase [Sphingosinithalassobacter tenebrarum]